MATGSFFVLGAGLLLCLLIAGVESIGVCYGINGNGLPALKDVVGLYQSHHIGAMRMYFPDQGTLQALRGTNIGVIVDVDDSNIAALASSADAAKGWVNANIIPFPDVAIRYIAVGNEIIPGNLAQFVLPAMQNIQNALNAANLQNKIKLCLLTCKWKWKVSTSVSTGVLGVSYPPSAGAFTDDARNYLQPIAGFLSGTGAPLLVNINPYFSYIGNPGQIPIEYALFTSAGPVITDGNLRYQNLFDAILDSTYSALEKVGAGGVRVVVSESGWPSDGGQAASPQNAQTYVQNLIGHVGNGTPKRPGAIETYIFAMFDEDRKQPQGTENHYGLFYPNMQPKYNLNVF
ncbi:hypothetical protein HPP92_006449 [Vanilla planifolia]|uniref:Uncharacterized protein n=1 Tax=Vanilla planifolia TaxID=51239 RepID=A0A835V747_VANPL|nr:hypothetical protein HPP92_006708 [Vanilla planifolia]KAG0489586.1 hypothetical protein HPP92_006449 [Vanilla planifolia]